VIVGVALLVAPMKPACRSRRRLLALAIVTPMSPCLYRIAFQPLAGASVLVPPIAAVRAASRRSPGIGPGLLRPEGFRAPAFAELSLDRSALELIPGQAICGSAGLDASAMMAGLYGFFERSLIGKALGNRRQPLSGRGSSASRPSSAGSIAFASGRGFIGAISGVLIVPLSTTYYDSGFMIGLQAASRRRSSAASAPTPAPCSAARRWSASRESFSSFWASALQGGDRVRRRSCRCCCIGHCDMGSGGGRVTRAAPLGLRRASSSPVRTAVAAWAAGVLGHVGELCPGSPQSSAIGLGGVDAASGG
jgi:branched-chain amino acid transport system permease protein